MTKGRTGIAWTGIIVSGLWVFSLTGCSDSSGGGSTSVAGIELPTEVSAVSAREDAGSSIRAGAAARGNAAAALLARNRALRDTVDELPSDSDYHQAKVRKFVEIKALDVFAIIKQIFDAVRQTHYELPENVNAGWYKAMVSWEDEGEGGVTVKRLQEWYINSTLVSVGGQTVNRVFFKVIEPDPMTGEPELIRVQADITKAPTKNTDGTLKDLGEWEIRAIFGPPESEETTGQFHAKASLVDGLTKLTISDSFSEEDPINGETITAVTRGVIYRSLDTGYGVVEYPDWEACFAPNNPADCSNGPPSFTVKFSYNSRYLTIQRVNPASAVVGGDNGGGGDETFSFDRADEHEIVHRYELFRTSDGKNVEKLKTFGFPVRYTAQDGSERFGWYGAWQDRHELWMDGGTPDDGSEVVRDDGFSQQQGATYTVKSFQGALSKVTLVAGSVDQLFGYPIEIFPMANYRLRWNAAQSRWDNCVGDDGQGGCTSQEDFTAKLPSLAYNGEDDRRWIDITGCFVDQNQNFTCKNYVYLTDNPGPGFFEAQWSDQTMRWESTGVQLDTNSLNDGDELFVNIGGQAFVEYTGDFDGPVTTTGWVEKTLTDFDESTWTPEFDPDGDREFVFGVGEEYFVNNRGTNLRVRRVAANGNAQDYKVYMESYNVAKPSATLDTIYPDGTILVEPWDPDNNSTYRLNKDPQSDNYLLLEFVTVSDADQQAGFQAGDVVTRDIWGLRIQGDNTPLDEATIYNWEYQDQGDFWGKVTYLKDSDGNFVFVSDPIIFQPIQLARTDDIVNNRPEDEWLTFSLLYDGFLHGLPDTWFELERVGFTGDDVPNILANNVRIPDGTVLTAEDGSTYFVKATDVGIFLGSVTDFPEAPGEPDLSLADDLNLDDELPDFTAPDLDSTVPADAELLYVRGVPVE